MNLERLLRPRSVALVGASADPKKISGMMVDFLRRSGYAGNVYPINPRYEAIGDWRCYPSVAALPETVDLVVVAVPASIAFEALDQAAERGVPFVVLMTGGFGEGTSGAEGDRRRERLQALCAKTGMQVLGPNTVGVVNFRDRMPLTFADWYGRDTGQRGGVAIVTHSGSVGGLIFSSLQASGVGVDYWVATGNEAILEAADVIDHLAGDPKLHTIACFMEGVVNGRKFMAAAAKARAAGKRVVVLKSGDSEASLRSTTAHTIKRSTNPDLYRAIFRQLGVVHVRSLQELTYCVKLLSTVGDRIAGRVGMLSASGGACSLISDHVVDSGLELPELTTEVQQSLAKWIPEYGSTRNPVDLSADVVSRRDILDGTFETLKDDALVDTWLVFGRPVIDRYHAEIRAFSAASGKAVIVSSGVAMRPEVQDALQEAGVPVLDDPQLCMRALGAIHRARGGAGMRDWRSEPSRIAGDVMDRASTRSWLSKHALDATSTTTERSGMSRIALHQDADFGPVLSIGRTSSSTSRDPARVARALPLDDPDLDALAREACDAASEGWSAAQSSLVWLLRAIRDAYAADISVAEIGIDAFPHGDRVEIGSASLHAVVRERR